MSGPRPDGEPLGGEPLGGEPLGGEPLLAVRDLHVQVRTPAGPLDILRGVDLAVHAGRTLAVVGESGSGKSFTALSIAGLLPAGASVRRGQVLLQGRDVVPLTESTRRAVRGAQVALVPQDPMTALNPIMRIGRQVAEGLTAHGWSRADATARTLDVLGEVGLPSPGRLVRLYPHQLSGGMRQRVLIACAIAPRPKVLIADEATTALDVTIQQQVLELVAGLRDSYGLAVVWITHDLGVVARIADDVAVMYAGRVVEQGPTQALFSAPQHPYTDGLLHSVPTSTARHQQPLPQIGGTPVSLAALPPGCPYATRCPQHRPGCDDAEPPLLDRGASRAACWVEPQSWRPPAERETVDA